METRTGDDRPGSRVEDGRFLIRLPVRIREFGFQSLVFSLSYRRAELALGARCRVLVVIDRHASRAHLSPVATSDLDRLGCFHATHRNEGDDIDRAQLRVRTKTGTHVDKLKSALGHSLRGLKH